MPKSVARLDPIIVLPNVSLTTPTPHINETTVIGELLRLMRREGEEMKRSAIFLNLSGT